VTRAEGEQRTTAEVDRYRERLASVLSALGIPRMPARVFAALFVSESGRMTAGELADTLQVSAAAVSGATRYLVGVGMASREREPGHRRDHYVVRDEMWRHAITNRQPNMKAVENTLREGMAVVGPDTHAGRRAAETVSFFEFLRGEMDGLMERWEAHRSSLGLSG